MLGFPLLLACEALGAQKEGRVSRDCPGPSGEPAPSNGPAACPRVGAIAPNQVVRQGPPQRADPEKFYSNVGFSLQSYRPYRAAGVSVARLRRLGRFPQAYESTLRTTDRRIRSRSSSIALRRELAAVILHDVLLFDRRLVQLVANRHRFYRTREVVPVDLKPAWSRTPLRRRERCRHISDLAALFA